MTKTSYCSPFFPRRRRERLRAARASARNHAVLPLQRTCFSPIQEHTFLGPLHLTPPTFQAQNYSWLVRKNLPSFLGQMRFHLQIRCSHKKGSKQKVRRGVSPVVSCYVNNYFVSCRRRCSKTNKLDSDRRRRALF